MKKALATIILTLAAAAAGSAAAAATATAAADPERDHFTLEMQDADLWMHTGYIAEAVHTRTWSGYMWIKGDNDLLYYANIDPEDLESGDRVIFATVQINPEYFSFDPEAAEVIRVHAFHESTK